MAPAFDMDRLPDAILERIFVHLDSVSDLSRVSQSCHRFRALLADENEQLWRSLTLNHMISPYSCLYWLERAQLPVDFPLPNTSWKAYYQRKHREAASGPSSLDGLPSSLDGLQRLQVGDDTLPMDTTTTNTNATTTIEDKYQYASREMEQVRAHMHSLAELDGGGDDDSSHLVVTSAVQQIGRRLLALVERVPVFLPAYHSLAVLCFLLRRPVEALELLELGREVDDATAAEHGEVYAPFEELEAEILRSMKEEEEEHGAGGDDDQCEDTMMLDDQEEPTQLHPQQKHQHQAPLLQSDARGNNVRWTDASVAKLSHFFHTFDRDRDGYWSYGELAAYMHVTNGGGGGASAIPSSTQYTGAHQASPLVPWSMWMQLIRRYGGDVRRGLPLGGYLRFYLDQTVQDEQETRKDIRLVEEFLQ